MPTALKVELLMKEIGDRNNRRLAELTGLDEAMIVRCKKLVFYDRTFQDLMLDPSPEKRIKSDFFIELYSVITDRDVVKFEWFSRTKFIRQMLSKYLEEPRTLRAVTDFRLVKQYITNARRIDALTQMSKRLHTFAEVHDTPLQHLEIQDANTHAAASSITKKLNTLHDLFADLDIEAFYGEEDMWRSVIRLAEMLETKLKEADKRH
ncbi:MAG: hypothetical protein ACRD3B_16890 [Candidatus Sulfotelmatobacter sp.]